MVSCLQSEDITICVAPSEHQTPISLFDQETSAFAAHFPTASNGISQERVTKLTMHSYFNSRLFCRDTRFAGDPEYIFYALDYTDKKRINSALSIAFRKHSPTSLQGPVTVGMLRDASQLSAILRQDLGYRFLSTIRGSPPYWEKTLRDLFAMLRQLGTPTWFCSFSAADRRWVEIPIAILKQQGKPIPDTLSWTEHCKIISSNPVTACRMFQERVRLFIHDVIMSPSQPIGEIIDFFYR